MNSVVHVFADFHTHTRHSHGKGSVLENVRAASRRALRAVAIADHGPANLFGVGVRDLETFDAIAAEIAAAQKEHPGVRVLLGVEANVVSLDGELDVPREQQARFDVLLAGLHLLVHPRRWREMGRLWGRHALARIHPPSRRKALVINTDALVAAVYRNRIDVITHPGYRLPVDTRELARACAARGTALEINARHPHARTEELRAAAAEGVRFVIGSDAHEPERVGDVASGVNLALAAGLSVEQVVNAVSAPAEVVCVHPNPFRVHFR